MMDNLARMHPVPVRDIWPSEDRNFTPWLAKNIDLLGDALGFDLEGADRSIQGRFGTIPACSCRILRGCTRSR